jgi:hypothetical protein
MRQSLIAAFLVLVTTAALGIAATPASKSSSAKVEPALAADPKVIQALAALGDNGACLLPGIKVHGDVGPIARAYRHDSRGPGGRDFTIKMAWMPDRRRAFYCGANHGSPHRLNDAWEYDLPSGTWVVL